MRLKKQNYITTTIIVMVIFLSGWLAIDSAIGATIIERLRGYILLQVEQNGEGWYVNPEKETRFYLGRPADAFDIMRFEGLGITNSDLEKIPVVGTNWTINSGMRDRVVGRILLQVEENGEAWYVYPENEKRYYLGRPADAFSIMRSLGLGITDSNLNQIDVDKDSMDLIEEIIDSEPLLTEFMIDFGPYNSETNKAGDFDFSNGREKVFGDFGRTVLDGEGNDKILPTFDMFVTAETPLVSPLDAKVISIIYQESTDDYEIHVRTTEDSIWTVSFDHVVNLDSTIVEGADIVAGQLLGNAASWSGTYLIELMITKSVDGGAQAYCPYNFFSSSLKSTFESGLNTLMNDWETYKGDDTIYDESAHVKPGCLMEEGSA